MPFKGRLKAGAAFNLDVSNAGASSDGTSVTVAFVEKRDRYAEVDTFTVPPTGVAPTSQTYTPATNKARVVIDVHPSAGCAAIVKVTQGVTMFEDPIVGDTTFIFDLVSS